MNISNILRSAQKLIPSDNVSNGFKYRKCIGTETNEYGDRVIKFTEWIDGDGHIQPGIVTGFGIKNISESDIKQLGLDMSRRSITIWINNANLSTVAGQSSSDQVLYDGRIFQIVNVCNWGNYNGWQNCFCQELIEGLDNV